MSDGSETRKIPKGEPVQSSLSKDEIDELSDMISDCMTSEPLDGNEDTGSFKTAKEDDTGEFKAVTD